MQRRDNLLLLACAMSVLAVAFLVLPARSPLPTAESSSRRTTAVHSESIQQQAPVPREPLTERVFIAATPPEEVATRNQSGETERTLARSVRGRVIDQDHVEGVSPSRVCPVGSTGSTWILGRCPLGFSRPGDSRSHACIRVGRRGSSGP